ncbi:ATP-binding protein [Blastococcus capsensis]|uniref:ATP-binding protein n=1 Tax=Blastococcus capsensis TaxID=1564163 RepID=UPI0025405211|nr:ATP-binding protein [Blastococcus capsensis]MDK3257936.1 ATP-binding protein [Blastococcus capsensis]
MSVALWQSARPPRGFAEVWRQELGSLSELAALRARLRTSMTGSRTVARPERDHWSERLVLIADELTSNALRHGGAPVAAVLGRNDHAWLIAVRDAKAEAPPVPAQGRDPGLGGFGLYLVADLSATHGWFTETGTKTTWAVVAVDEG